jgi:pimeloyl-ACP methyl ester carboxylesterase
VFNRRHTSVTPGLASPHQDEASRLEIEPIRATRVDPFAVAQRLQMDRTCQVCWPPMSTPQTQPQHPESGGLDMSRISSGSAASTTGNGADLRSAPTGNENLHSDVPFTSIQRVEADGVRIFYRAAGDKDAPVVLLLHGFPSSSFMFRELIPRLADRYRVIAPDLPGFGFTEVPEGRQYTYSFDALAGTIEAFTEALGLTRYAIYVFDYGAPTGFRLAMRHPERVTAIVSQNGNAYEEGLGDAWAPIRQYWSQPTSQNRETIRQAILNFEGTRWQYTHGVTSPDAVAPESYTLDAALLERPGNKEIQLDLFLDYASNVKLYPTFQDYFRRKQPSLLAIWGRNDPFFLPPGAEAFRKDIPGAQVRFLDTGHFALETHVVEIAAAIRDFLQASGVAGQREIAAVR